jgi:ATP synthase protein I
MPEYKTMFGRQRKYIFYLLAIYVLGWGFSSYQAIFLGLILGTSLSLFNLWLLVRKMDHFGNAIEKGSSVRSLGFISRIATAIFAVMIAIEYSEYFNLISVIIGLMTSYFVIIIDYFFQHFHLDK